MRLRIVGTIATLALAVLAAPLANAAQQPGKLPLVGLLGDTAGSQWETFRQALRDLGYVEGRTIAIEGRYSEGNAARFPDLAAELVRLGADVIVTEGESATQAAKKATSTIPVVMAITADPVGRGLVASLARPGGNITGSMSLSFELTAKQMELLKETLPALTKLAILRAPGPSHDLALRRHVEPAARALRVHLQFVEAQVPGELDKAFSTMNRERPDALLVLPNPMIDAQQRRIAGLTTQSRLPAVYNKPLFAQAGGLMAYGARYLDFFQRAATYVDKILKGAKPANLPVEQPTRFELVINLKTAKGLGLTIPRSILIRADQVIQ